MALELIERQGAELGRMQENNALQSPKSDEHRQPPARCSLGNTGFLYESSGGSHQRNLIKVARIDIDWVQNIASMWITRYDFVEVSRWTGFVIRATSQVTDDN